MNITIRYTQPTLIQGQVIRTADHVILCHDVDTHPNGQPVADGADSKWNGVISGLNGSGVGASSSIGNGGGYERIL